MKFPSQSISCSSKIEELTEYLINGNLYKSYTDLPRNIYETLSVSAKSKPNKVALVEESEAITFSNLLRRVDALAASLRHTYEIQRGQVCALLMTNSIDFCVAFYAIMRIGAIALPLSTKLTKDELTHPLIHSKCRLLILDETWYANVSEIHDNTYIKNLIFSGNGEACYAGDRMRNMSTLPNLEAEQPTWHDGAILIYTSGTTGKPKGAYITHFNALHSIESYRRIFALSDQDSTIISTPIFHITGLIALMALFLSIGGTVHLQPTFNAVKTLKCIQDSQLTFYHASPTIFILLLEHQADFPHLPSLRLGACGSANLPIDVITKLRNWMPNFRMRPVYGLTETTSPATIMPQDPLDIGHAGSSGLPIPGIQVRVIDADTRNRLPVGEIGEIEVKGSVVIERYFEADEESSKAFHEGWFNTGDIGQFDKDGYLYVLDRKKDMINRGGEKIYSVEVENAISKHPDVLECAVYGLADPIYGEQVRAMVKLRERSDLTAETLAIFLRHSLAKYKMPVVYDFVESIPKTENGKVDKKRIRQLTSQSTFDRKTNS
jgi:long-chain acyl-CoA synthetase